MEKKICFNDIKIQENLQIIMNSKVKNTGTSLFGSGKRIKLKPATTPDPKKKISSFFRLKKQENTTINLENLRIIDSIIKTQPSLSVKKLEKDYKKSRTYMKFLKKPIKTSKSPRCVSRQETNRPLIDTLNTYIMNF
jgi:hypothetical protein